MTMAEDSDKIPSEKLTSSSQWSLAIQNVRSGILGSYEIVEERSTQESDFDEHKKRSLESLNFVLDILQSTDPDEIRKSNEHLQHFIVPVILLCSENSQKFQWTNSTHIEKSYHIQNLLKVKFFEKDSMSKVLLDTCIGSKILLLLCLSELRPKLLKHLWRQNLGAKHSFLWLLHQCCFPNLGAHLSEFLPFSLQFTDDWSPDNKILGIQCLHHIIREVVATEIKFFGRADLIKTTLLKLMHSKDVRLLDCLFPCLIDFLKKVQCPKTSPEHFARFDDWDETVNQLMTSLELESKLDLKRCYLNFLLQLLKEIKLGSVRWMTAVIRVTGECLQYSDPVEEEARILSVQILTHLAIVGQQRIPGHAKDIFEILLRLLYEISQSPQRCQLLVTASECLSLFAKITPEHFFHLCHGLDQVSVNPVFDDAIKKAFESAKN